MPCTQALLILSVYIGINAVPPEACFAKFRWDDCGRPPVRVLYYWKPGSRCEVGVWRGCLPNLNMFHDEYECVATCIFTARAESADYHALAGVEQFDNETLSDTEKIDDDEASSKSDNEATTQPDDFETSPNGKDEKPIDEDEKPFGKDKNPNGKDDVSEQRSQKSESSSSKPKSSSKKNKEATDPDPNMNE